ncbi:MAG TPA: DUF1801 domain-containing protein [Cryomorphaceae bacterium]|nr:DUF1801 domain-containing protein [Cryomorphaceae bacterium]
MQYEVNSPSEYLDKLEDDWRKDRLNQVREIIKKYGPDLNEGIQYKMLSYDLNGRSIFNLNAQRAYVSLYVGTISKLDNASDLLKAFDTGKGCIRIKKSAEIQETGLEEFIERTIELWRAGGNTAC